jgi:site-specific recombinase XerD
MPGRYKMLEYRRYLETLKKYCVDAGIREIATHGLRHSTSEVYMSHGATRDDLRLLFAHSSNSTTDRYVHDRGSRLEKVAEVIQLFPGVSKKFPKSETPEEVELKGGASSNEVN